VDVHYVEGNHITMLTSDKVITAINGDSLKDPKEFMKILTDDQPLECEKEERTRV